MDTYTKRYNNEAVKKEFGSGFSSIEEAKTTFNKHYGDIDKFKGGDNEVRNASMEEAMALVAFGFCSICEGVGGYWCPCCCHRACPCAVTNQSFYIDCCGYCDGTGQWKNRDGEINYNSEAHKEQFQRSEGAISKFGEQKKEAERVKRLEEENQDYQRLPFQYF